MKKRNRKRTKYNCSKCLKQLWTSESKPLKEQQSGYMLVCLHCHIIYELLDNLELIEVDEKIPDGQGIEIIMPKEDKCVACGCTDMRTCEGGCYWVMPNKCSACFGKGGNPWPETPDEDIDHI